MNKKSGITLQAAQQLINQRFFTQSVHCSYYAVLQLIKHKLAVTSDHPITYKDQDKLTKNRDSHEFLLIEIKNRISRPKDKKEFGELFRDLKAKRVDADYSIRQFTDIESLNCKECAEKLISKLNYYFNAV